MADSFLQRLRKLFGAGAKNAESDPRKNTYRQILEAFEDQGLTGQIDKEMIKGVLEFGETIVREVMVPRTEIVYADINDPIQKVISAVIDSGHSRIPIVEGHLDNIKGIFYAKDLLSFWGSDSVDLSKIIRPPYMIPETKKVAQLLDEWKKRKRNIAIVIDEYGGTAGIAALEDLVEEIMGELEDEDEQPFEPMQHQEDGTILFDARVSLSDFADQFGVTPPDDNIDTISGLILFISGRIPPVGEEFEFSGLLLKVEDADNKTVKKVRVTRISD